MPRQPKTDCRAFFPILCRFGGIARIFIVQPAAFMDCSLAPEARQAIFVPDLTKYQVPLDFCGNCATVACDFAYGTNDGLFKSVDGDFGPRCGIACRVAFFKKIWLVLHLATMGHSKKKSKAGCKVATISSVDWFSFPLKGAKSFKTPTKHTQNRLG